jgi:hypothetical protein
MDNKKYYGGALFMNRNKTSDKQPDVSGDVEISMDLLKVLVTLAKEGQPLKMRMAGWVKEGRSGKFYSISLSENKASNPKPKVALDDDIPF